MHPLAGMAAASRVLPVSGAVQVAAPFPAADPSPDPLQDLVLVLMLVPVRELIRLLHDSAPLRQEQDRPEQDRQEQAPPEQDSLEPNHCHREARTSTAAIDPVPSTRRADSPANSRAYGGCAGSARSSVVGCLFRDGCCRTESCPGWGC